MVQSPPTTSGIVVISGSAGFDLLSSDFPVLQGFVKVEPLPAVVLGSDPETTSDLFMGLGRSSGLSRVIYTEASSVNGFVPDQTLDYDITKTTVTTSGIVIFDLFPGAGEEYIVPVVGNVRLFPEAIRVYPPYNVRIFPLLPQFSTITPGD